LTIGVDKAVVGRLVISGQKFEILVDPKLALEFKKGTAVNMNELLAYPVVYKDVKTTEAVAEGDLQKSFGTTDVFKIAEKILKDGEIQLTTDQKREMINQKKTQIAAIISKKAINPQTNTPHPPQRIMNVMDQAGVSIDPFSDAGLQVDRVVKEIKTKIPIKFQKITLQVKIPPQFSGKAHSIFKAVGTIKNEQWLSDGSLQVNIEILAGVQEELTDKLSSFTHGNYESKVIQREDV